MEGMTDQRLLQALMTVPRADFRRAEHADPAYLGIQLPICHWPKWGRPRRRVPARERKDSRELDVS